MMASPAFVAFLCQAIPSGGCEHQPHRMREPSHLLWTLDSHLIRSWGVNATCKPRAPAQLPPGVLGSGPATASCITSEAPLNSHCPFSALSCHPIAVPISCAISSSIPDSVLTVHPPACPLCHTSVSSTRVAPKCLACPSALHTRC